MCGCEVRKAGPLKSPEAGGGGGEYFLKTSASPRLFTQDITTTTNRRYRISAGYSPPMQRPFLPHSNCMGQVVLIVPMIQTQKPRVPKTRHLPSSAEERPQMGSKTLSVQPRRKPGSNTQQPAPTSHLSSHFPSDQASQAPVPSGVSHCL